MNPRTYNNEPVRIRGNCPMGCGPTLFLDIDRRIRCDSLACPNPHALHEILQPRQPLHALALTAVS